MTLHSEVLRPPQRRVLRSLGPLAAGRGFYLAGGTALALQLGHRRSVDLDWFAERFPDPVDLIPMLQIPGARAQLVQQDEGTLHAVVAGVSVSFLAYRYPLLAPALVAEEHGALLASMDDIASMKLSAITQRGARKDFVDIYALGVNHRPLSEMLGLYQQKYGFLDRLHVLRALTYFADADAQPMPPMLWRLNWRTVKSTIQSWVRELAP